MTSNASLHEGVTLWIFLIEGMFFGQFYPYPWSLLGKPPGTMEHIESEDVVIFLKYWTMGMQGSLNYQFWGIKQYKRMVVLRDFPYNSTLFGFVIQWPPICSIAHACLPYHFKRSHQDHGDPPSSTLAGTAWKCWAFQSDWAESQVDDGDFLQDLTMLFHNP